MIRQVTAADTPIVRRATVDDAEALVRLRALMLKAMGTDAGPTDAPWWSSGRDWFVAQLASPYTFAAYVAELPGVGVVANAAGICNGHAPSPNDPSTVRGHLFNVSTDPAYRRRGLARACVVALLDWYRDETTAGQVELHATKDGDGLYRELGFLTSTYPAQRLRLER